jgi:hypothetical protein
MPLDTVMIIRHGEKPPAFGNGVSDQGELDEYSLAVRGWTRAGALIGFFGHDHDGIVRPDFICAAEPVSKGASLHGRRPLETVTPLALALNIELNSSVAVGNEQGLVTLLKGETRTTLISWEHHAIKTIVQKVLIPGFATDFPNRFDLVWLFTKSGTGYTFVEINQHLLADDAP